MKRNSEDMRWGGQDLQGVGLRGGQNAAFKHFTSVVMSPHLDLFTWASVATRTRTKNQNQRAFASSPRVKQQVRQEELLLLVSWGTPAP